MASTHQFEADKTESRRDLWTIVLLPDAKGSFSNGLPTLCGELHKAEHRLCSTQGDAAFTPPYERRLKANQDSPEVYGGNKRHVAEGEASKSLKVSGYSDSYIDADKKDRKSVTGGNVSVDGIPLRVDRQDALKRLEGMKASSKVKPIDVPSSAI
ncbi:hypothetical protein PHPALM_27853 [Phytophthora palmivora]|uniref:Uncharacterized protein n=1 Tax=Phytophthora palmivora TaxID=4796 RepID=A0A2P4XBJ1_9STRA|nr:hypothetical protein PHPALM_27853 [Phytophthora palmivora]